jgi:hypoxanthine phosphoribosyltransferase
MTKSKISAKKSRATESAGQAPGETVRILISRERIHRRIKEIARQIRKDFSGQPLHLVGVLKGAVFFLADLAREIPGEVSFDFIALSSYGKNTHSSGQVRLTRDLDSSIEGKTVIVVEDILDTGMTLQYLLRVFQHRKPKALRVAVLLDKPSRRITPVQADYVGFSIPNAFVVGYGLDYAERYRNLLDVGVLTLPASEPDAGSAHATEPAAPAPATYAPRFSKAKSQSKAVPAK